MRPAVLRPLLHASTALTWLLTLWSWEAFRFTLTGAAMGAIALEALRLRDPRFRAWLAARVPVFRPGEMSRVSGAAWLSLGYAVVAWLPAPAAGAGVLTAALADPAGALIGGRLGSTTKTWPGTAAVWAAALTVLVFLGLSWPVALAGAAVGAVAERWSGPVNDNLAVPLAVGGVIWALT